MHTFVMRMITMELLTAGIKNLSQDKTGGVIFKCK